MTVIEFVQQYTTRTPEEVRATAAEVLNLYGGLPLPMATAYCYVNVDETYAKQLLETLLDVWPAGNHFSDDEARVVFNSNIPDFDQQSAEFYAAFAVLHDNFDIDVCVKTHQLAGAICGFTFDIIAFRAAICSKDSDGKYSEIAVNEAMDSFSYTSHDLQPFYDKISLIRAMMK